jgi:hypothetical protein
MAEHAADLLADTRSAAGDERDLSGEHVSAERGWRTFAQTRRIRRHDERPSATLTDKPIMAHDEPASRLAAKTPRAGREHIAAGRHPRQSHAFIDMTHVLSGRPHSSQSAAGDMIDR